MSGITDNFDEFLKKLDYDFLYWYYKILEVLNIFVFHMGYS